MSIDPKRVFILIDGFENSFAQETNGSNNLKEMIAIARDWSTESKIEVMSTNIGTAQSFATLRSWIYADEPEWALFLEEDMTLHTYHSKFISEMIEKLDSFCEVAQISCFWTNDFSCQESNFFRNSFGTKVFAERYQSYLKFRRDYQRYIEIIADYAYHHRDVVGIQRRLLESGFFTFHTQQDCFTQFLLNRHGLLHLTGPLDLARDIGMLGSNDTRGTTLRTVESMDESELLEFAKILHTIGNDCIESDIERALRVSKDLEIQQLQDIFRVSEFEHSFRESMRHALKVGLKKLRARF